MKKIVITSGIVNLALCFSLAQPGSLDNTFGIGGKVITPIGKQDDYGSSVAIQNDGKMVVAGFSWTDSGGYDFVLVRYNNDGNLDNSFGDSGIVLTDFGSSSDEAYSIVIQADGKIIVAGKGDTSYTDNPSAYDFALVRYNTNGTLDHTFGTAGKVLTDIGSSTSDYGYSVILQDDGKIVVAGSSGNGSDPDFAVVRYNNNGTLDNTFDSDGKVTTDFGGNDIAKSVAIQKDGKLVVAGYSDSEKSSYYDFALARYNSNGSLDYTFGTNGKLRTDLGSQYDFAGTVLIQPDGKIVVVGLDGSWVLARYNSDGSLDNTFDSDGKVTTPINGSSASAMLQRDGKIVVVGYSSDSLSPADFALARYNTDGSLDATFGDKGKVTTDFGGTIYGDYANSIGIRSDGKIVVAGRRGRNFSSTNFVWDIVVARYENDIFTGIENKQPGSAGLEIFPNPSSGIYSINFCGLKDPTLCVYDLFGNYLWNKNYQNVSSAEIDLSSQRKGIYFLEVISEGKRSIEKIVLK